AEEASEMFSSFLYIDLRLVRESAIRARSSDGSDPPGWPPGSGVVGEVTMRTQGEVEAAVCEGITRFEQEYMGRGPRDIRAHLIGDLLVVRLQGVLTAAEQQLVRSRTPEKGRDLLKQVRTQLIETARPVLEGMVETATGVK